jgi:CBS domain-containing protein
VLNRESRQYFLQELRQARLAAQRDAEAFDQLLFAIERLGCFLLKRAATLGAYKEPLLALAKKAALGGVLPTTLMNWHSNMNVLFALVTQARNDALHQGAGARHLTEHAIELTLLFEDALMNGDDSMMELRDIMVRSPITAEPWQPLSFVRQVMLTNSFSYLPIWIGGKWSIITDSQVACFLRNGLIENNRNARLGMTVEDSTKAGLRLTNAVIVPAETSIAVIANRFVEKPEKAFVLICDDDLFANKMSNRLLGIVTAFDIL